MPARPPNGAGLPWPKDVALEAGLATGSGFPNGEAPAPGASLFAPNTLVGALG